MNRSGSKDFEISPLLDELAEDWETVTLLPDAAYSFFFDASATLRNADSTHQSVSVSAVRKARRRVQRRVRMVPGGSELGYWLYHGPEFDLLGEEVRGHLGELNNQPAHVRGRNALVEDLGSPRREACAGREVGLAPRGQNRGDAYPVGAEFCEQAAREHEQPGFGCGIHAPSGPCMRRAGGANIHNKARTLPLHDNGGTATTKHGSSA